MKLLGAEVPADEVDAYWVHIVSKIVFKWDWPKILADLRTDVLRYIYASIPGNHKDISASQLSNSFFMSMHESLTDEKCPGINDSGQNLLNSQIAYGKKSKQTCWFLMR